MCEAPKKMSLTEVTRLTFRAKGSRVGPKREETHDVAKDINACLVDAGGRKR